MEKKIGVFFGRMAVYGISVFSTFLFWKPIYTRGVNRHCSHGSVSLRLSAIRYHNALHPHFSI